MPIRVDFHCRLIFKCVYKHVNFNLVNKIEARYKVLSFFFTVERGSNFTFSCDLSNIASILTANINFRHVRDNGNPPSISFNKESLLKRCCYYSTPPIARTYRTRIGFLYRVIFTYVHIRKQIVTLVERGSTFSFTCDLPYNASILFTRVLSDSGNPPAIRFCALCMGFLLKVSFSSRFTVFTVINLVYPPPQMLHYHC